MMIIIIIMETLLLALYQHSRLFDPHSCNFINVEKRHVPYAPKQHIADIHASSNG